MNHPKRPIPGLICMLLFSLAACADSKLITETTLAPARDALLDVEFELNAPTGTKLESKGASDQGQGMKEAVFYVGDDILTITITLAKASTMEAAASFEKNAGRTVRRSDKAADGYFVTSEAPDGRFINTRRAIERGERALFCSASVSWKAPSNDPKRVEFVESICSSLKATKFAT
jgi:hypothetical protein